MTVHTALSRRSFLVSATALAGGLVLGVSVPGRGWAQASSAPTEINAWIVVAPDETVTIRLAQSEMGQGVMTALPMMVAEELDCAWANVKVENASAARARREDDVYGRMRTGGSRAVRGGQDLLRRAGAAARAMLLEAAARRWNVPVLSLTTLDGVVEHAPTSRRATYGELATDASKLLPPTPESLTLKAPERWRIMGRPMPRLDTPSKVDGSAVFGIDVRLPGLLYAAVAMCPVQGGLLRSFRAEAVHGMPGVRHVVKVDDAAVAVVADRWWQARQAVDALPIHWDEGAGAATEQAALLESFLQALEEAGAEAERVGDAETAMAEAARVVEFRYVAPYLSHAQLEPVNATALVHPDGRVEVWAPTQDPAQALTVAAEAATVDPSQVEVHVTLLGGAFGRRLTQDYVAQAVRIANQVKGTPVQMLWSREDDMRHGFYRPLSMVSFRGGLDEQNRVVATDTRVVNHSIIASLAPEALENGVDDSGTEGLTGQPYAIPNRRVGYTIRASPLRPFFWRAVGHSQNAFFTESFIDELAHAAGADPYRFRRDLMGEHPRHRAVLDAAADAAGWGTPLPSGQGRGIAVHEAYDTVAAEVVEVSVAPDTGELRIHRVVAVVDTGFVVNPDTLRAQIEGGIVFGLSAALHGEITVAKGRVEQSNYFDYDVLRLAETPRMEVHIVPSGEKWGGAGEPGLPPVAPALANAIFAASGKRIRTLPIKDQLRI